MIAFFAYLIYTKHPSMQFIDDMMNGNNNNGGGSGSGSGSESKYNFSNSFGAGDGKKPLLNLDE